MAAPLIVPRALHQLSTNGIEMNVSNERKKIFITVTEQGFIPSLKNMTHLVVLSVEILSIGQVDSLHDFGERDISSFYQQMDVVRHEDIRVENEAFLFFVAPDSCKVCSPIFVIDKDILSLVTPDDDVVEGSWEFNTVWSCHKKHCTKLDAYMQA